ncbi:MAG TPA: methyltransferase domain-containing protein [Blastocatellia bacterium]|jgi:predicted SAM-dependent methyltransferase|nr:methyltransferase domain-containing protein [Blastocatellia bacterium]
MKELIKRLIKNNDKAHVAATSIFLRFRRLSRIVFPVDQMVIKKYMSTVQVRKLQIGSGTNFIQGWLNSDIDPLKGMIKLDVTKTFPFNDSVFDYIYCEHMIEHFYYTEGVKILSECYRILKSNGKIRVATPDLPFLVELYRANKTELQKKYIEWSTDSFIPTAPFYADTYVINNYFRDWGHKFIYDEKVLRFAMKEVGFTNIIRCLLNESEDKELQGLEYVGRMPDGFLELETFILEGTKPVSAPNKSGDTPL